VWRDFAGADDLRVPPGETAPAQWRYDPLRGQYYWHRFLPHTPDLNFANPAVQDAMLGVLRRWLDLGIDGFRLVAVPYLHRRDDAAGETHAYLRRMREEVDRLYPGRVLIADANQWPLQAAAYFGGTPGDECHMVLYASLMPRLFLAMRQEDHLPVSELLLTAPGIPDSCQWGVLLRNGDTLSLEGLTEPDRAYLLEEYAPRPRMRTEDGIRRRLAPLLDNDRTLLELAFSLLLSMPGSPIIYYGDEIGMGDNLALAGIHSVRTPMQWSPDRNGGFSTAEPDRLALPALMDSVFGYQAINVEAQRRSRSLLSFLRRLLEIRRHNPAFALGELRVIKTTNPAILAYVRIHQGARVLCVTNFSRYPQAVELDLGGYLGRTPVEILGGSRFLPVESPAYPMTLSGHGFYWLTL
jgi:maltose alpha-D-glucosyltransferase/alpha-amylase